MSRAVLAARRQKKVTMSVGMTRSARQDRAHSAYTAPRSPRCAHRAALTALRPPRCTHRASTALRSRRCTHRAYTTLRSQRLRRCPNCAALTALRSPSLQPPLRLSPQPPLRPSRQPPLRPPLWPSLHHPSLHLPTGMCALGSDRTRPRRSMASPRRSARRSGSRRLRLRAARLSARRSASGPEPASASAYCTQVERQFPSEERLSLPSAATDSEVNEIESVSAVAVSAVARKIWHWR